MDQTSLKLLLDARVVFFDFDGVIKDSLEVKADAFEHLFQPYGSHVSKRVRRHHEANGGMSRFEKLPLYLEWAGLDRDPTTLKGFAHSFSLLTKTGVIESPWVAGMPEYLHKNVGRQVFYLFTATPENEISKILHELKIDHFFSDIKGSPETKVEAIANTIINHNLNVSEAIFIGDSKVDYEASTKNHIKFILRRTKFNSYLESLIRVKVIDDFVY
ncbi:HAD family hydrolase [Alphaproteobacteria bacterium LSUCC0744]